jgi:branched-chain amino acid transport system permease protein
MKRVPHIAGVLLAVAVVVGLTLALNNDYYLRILFMMGVYYLCAAGMNVLVGYAGQKSLGQAGLFAAGAYAVALLTTRTEISPWVALALAAVVSGVFGVLIALPSLRVKGPYLAMVTLAFGIVVEKLVSEWTDVFGGAQGVYGIRPLSWGEEPLSTQQWVWLTVALCAITHLLLRNLVGGRFGRALLSLQADEIASSSVGVRVYRAKVIAFVVAAVTCGIAGALVAQQNQYINSDFITFHLSIFILLLVLFGGAGSQYGPLVGTVILTAIDAALARWPAAQHFLYGFLLLFALYAMPGGVMGLLGTLTARWRQKPALPSSVEPRAYRPAAADASGDLLVVENVSKAFGGVKPAQDVSFRLQRGHVHALIGPNGAGKSTLFKIITGQEQPDEGKIEIGDTVRLGYVDQSRDHLDASHNVWEEISGGHDYMTVNGNEMSTRAYVGAFNFKGPDQQKNVGKLSGGERNRVHLAKMLKEGGNVLLLDEPTNDLDVETLAALEDAIENFAGCAVVISHDRFFLDRLATHILAFEGNSHVEWFEGNFEAYEEDKRARLGDAADRPTRLAYKKLTR